jgi:hypothetical protein
MNGWNGQICGNPSCNRYCIGPHSYPGDKIKKNRDLNWEQSVAGQCCSKFKEIPTCIYSINAFGNRETALSIKTTPDTGLLPLDSA